MAARGVRVFVFLAGGVVFRLLWSKEGISSGAAAAVAKPIQRAAASPYEVDFQLANPINKAAKLKLESVSLLSTASPGTLHGLVA